MFSYYLSNMSGTELSYKYPSTKFLFLESDRERILYSVNLQNFTFEIEDKYSLSKLEPSYPCQRASGHIERIICSEAGITTMDNILADIYRPLKYLDNIANSQKIWIRNRNNTCSRVPLPLAEDCVAEHYQKRILELIEIGKEVNSAR